MSENSNPPERIGKYRVKHKLGEGATSEVYLCHDPFYEREVAIKLVFPEAFDDPERGRLFRKLFITEASLAGKLSHPHICQIFDAVSEDDAHYIVMEYVGGGTLEQFCRYDTLLPLERVVQMVFKCTRALEYAQKMGITHRDIKPANVLYAGGDDVKITDFGTALLAGGETTQISAIGSPAYMSPEQVKERALDHRTDIYSVGVVLYHLLTGRLPFQASNNFSLIYQITNVDPAPPSSLRREIPATLDAIVGRAMARELDVRYARWDELAQDLAQALQPEDLPQAVEFPESERFETLRDLAFFDPFSDAELWEVVRISNWRSVEAGDVLMREGEPGTHFCVLADGQMKVTKKQKLLNILRPGEPFGEMAYLSRAARRRIADVTAMTEATVITIQTEALEQASESCQHKFDRAFMEILVERLAMSNVRLSGV